MIILYVFQFKIKCVYAILLILGQTLLLVSLGPPSSWAPESFPLFSILSGGRAVMGIQIKNNVQEDGKHSISLLACKLCQGIIVFA